MSFRNDDPTSEAQAIAALLLMSALCAFVGVVGLLWTAVTMAVR